MNVHNKWGLLNSLISILNDTQEDATNTVLAKYFLSNFGELNKLNIYDAAEQCYTTRSAIRRFCQRLGYDNFKSLKEEAQEYIDEGYTYYKLYENVDDYPSFLCHQISLMAKDCNLNLIDKIELIVDLIHDCNQLVFVVSDVYLKHCTDFQKQMIINGKMVRIVGQKFDDNPLLKSLNQDDLLLVVSVGGFFESVIRDLVHGISCHKILMTSRHDECYSQIYDQVIHICSHDLGKQRTVYHSFAVEYCLNIIATAYQMKYKNK